MYTHVRPHTLVPQVPAQDRMAEEVLPFRASAKASAAIAGAGLASPAACKLLHGGVLQAPTCAFSCMACLHWPGQSSGVVQVHEVKGNLSTAGYSACSSAAQQRAEVRSPFSVVRAHGCAVCTDARCSQVHAQCSRVHGVHLCMVFTGAQCFTAARCFTGAHYFQVCIICIDSLVGPLGEEVRLITTAVDGCRGGCGCAVRLSLLALHLSDLPLLTAGVRLRAVIEVRLVRHGTARDWHNTAHQRTRLARHGAAWRDLAFVFLA